MAYFWYTPRKLGTEAIKRIVLKSPLGNGRKSCELEGVIVEYPTYDVLVERASVQPRNECLDGEECGQDAGKHKDKPENDRDTCRHANRSMKVPLQWRTIIVGVVVSKLLDPESTGSPPPDRDLALEDLPVLYKSSGPQDKCDGVVRRIRCPEQPESTADCGDDGESFGVSREEVEVQSHFFSKLKPACRQK